MHTQMHAHTHTHTHTIEHCSDINFVTANDPYHMQENVVFNYTLAYFRDNPA